MKLSEVKELLGKLQQVEFVLPSGQEVPKHFHVTEVGQIDKNFIDCGGTQRKESVVSFQLYTATDYDHRLSAEKLRSIIELSEKQLGLKDLDIEVEYQGDTIGKYGLSFNGKAFVLTSKQTDCLAKDQCGIPEPELETAGGGCDPNSGCC